MPWRRHPPPDRGRGLRRPGIRLEDATADPYLRERVHIRLAPSPGGSSRTARAPSDGEGARSPAVARDCLQPRSGEHAAAVLVGFEPGVDMEVRIVAGHSHPGANPDVELAGSASGIQACSTSRISHGRDDRGRGFPGSKLPWAAIMDASSARLGTSTGSRWCRGAARRPRAPSLHCRPGSRCCPSALRGGNGAGSPASPARSPRSRR